MFEDMFRRIDEKMERVFNKVDDALDKVDDVLDKIQYKNKQMLWDVFKDMESAEEHEKRALSIQKYIDSVKANKTHLTLILGIHFGQQDAPTRAVLWSEVDYNRDKSKDLPFYKFITVKSPGRAIFHCERIVDSYKKAGLECPSLWIELKETPSLRVHQWYRFDQL
jgi:hypothetical protein